MDGLELEFGQCADVFLAFGSSSNVSVTDSTGAVATSNTVLTSTLSVESTNSVQHNPSFPIKTVTVIASGGTPPYTYQFDNSLPVDSNILDTFLLKTL